MAAFETQILVRFEHTDVAGIVFYPRYFEMISMAVEDWFQNELGIKYRKLHQVDQRGIPLAEIHCKFSKPSFLSDVLTFRLAVRRLGRSSITLHIDTFCGEELRMQADMTIVYAGMSDQGPHSVPIPADLAEKIRRFTA
jgi:4-hydroxybenzoyl-CoA thioesterase